MNYIKSTNLDTTIKPIILLLSNIKGSGLDQYAEIYANSTPEAYYFRMSDYRKTYRGLQWIIFLQLFFHKFSIIKKILYVIKDVNSKRIHICDNPIFSYFLILKLIKLNYQIIFTLHDPEPHVEEKLFLKFKSKIKTIFFKKIFILSAEQPNNLMIHVHDKGLVPLNFPKIKLIDLPHPLYENSSIRIPDQSILTRPKIHFIYLGRIEYYKGIDLIINALNILDMDGVFGPKIKCTIAGTGDYSIKPKKYNNIEFKFIDSYISNDEFSNFLRSADYILLPYRDVTQSGIFSKALTNSIPVICNDVGYLGKSVRQNLLGYVMNECTAESLANCIINSLKDRNSHKLFIENINTYKIELQPEILSRKLYSNFLLQ